jgi:peroxiredoxin
MLPLGTPVPAFRLEDAVTGRMVTEAAAAGREALLVMFICNHCPFVLHVLEEIGSIASDCERRGVAVIAINSNDVRNYPQDGPDRMRELALREDWSFPFLLDETQEVAKAFRAACTPDFFLFDGGGALVYRGQLDDSRPGNGLPVTGRDLRAALDAVLAGQPVPEPQLPSVGCNIKWKRGNAPPYYG